MESEVKVTYFLALFFILSFIIGTFLPNSILSNYLYLSLENLAQGKIWTFFTSMFLFSGAVHFIWTFLPLIFFGYLLEKRISSKKFLLIFLLGTFINYLYHISSFLIGIRNDIGVPIVGSMGGVLAISGAVIILEGRKQEFDFLGVVSLAAVILGIFTFLSSILSLPFIEISSAHTPISFIPMSVGLIFGAIIRTRGIFRRVRGKEVGTGVKILVGLSGAIIIARQPLSLIAILIVLLWYFRGEIFNR